MKTAEQFAREAIRRAESTISDRDVLEILVSLFQAALDAPMELTDDKPTGEGFCWYERYKTKITSLVSIDSDDYGNLIAYEAKTGSYIGLVIHCKGRFSHMIKLPEGGK